MLPGWPKRLFIHWSLCQHEIPGRLPSVIIFRLRNMHPERVNRYLREIITLHQDMLEQGAIPSVAEGQMRVRLLPFEMGNE